MRPLGDRRQHARFEVFGAFWGAFGINEPVRVVNITQNGALLDTPRAIPVESVQSVHLTVDGLLTKVDGRVRHLTASSPVGRQERYLIGLEFVSPSTPFLESVEHLVHLVTPSDPPPLDD
jgi:hypothetical protein